MRKYTRLAAAAGLAVLTGAAVLSAPAMQSQTISVGETVSVTVAGEGPESAAEFILEVTEPSIVTVLATSSDGSDPVFLVRDQYDRELITVNDNPASELAGSELDAVIDDTLLIPGRYTFLVGRNSLVGGGQIDFSILPGRGGVIAPGEIQMLDGAIGAGERYELPLQLEAGQLVSFGALGLGQQFDLRMNLRGPAGVVARDDDNVTFDIFLTDLDPRIYQHRVAESGEYTLVVRPFSADVAGEFKLVIQNHGTLSGDVRTEVLTSESETRARNVFHIDFDAGEIVRITARADGSSLDPEIDLLTPNNIFIATNDDHGTDDEDLGRFDARIDRIVIEETGTYELNVNSISGRGPFEVIVERLGVYAQGGSINVDASAARVVAPAPTIVPEVTVEPTSG